MKDGKLSDSGKQREGKTFHKLHVLGINDNLWDRVGGVGSETWKGQYFILPWLTTILRICV